MGVTTVKDVASALKGLGYSFRLNVLDNSVEVNDKRLDDVQAATIRARMRELGYRNPREVEDVIVTEAAQHGYHPVQSYLLSTLNDWDGGAHIKQLATYFAEDYMPQPIFPLLLRRWLIGAVARAMGGRQNAMLVLVGHQGLGKDYFAKWLCQGLPELFLESGIDPDSRDARLEVARRWIWSVSELGGTTRRRDVEALKAFITREQITERLPYGRYPIVKPALASFIGSVNDDGGFLVDRTGNRRFWLAKIASLDWSYANDLDVSQVWGEAATAYYAGEPWQLTPNEAAKAEENAEEALTPDPIEGKLGELFEIDPTDTTAWTATHTILEALEFADYRFSSPRAGAMEIARVLTSKGCKKRKGMTASAKKQWRVWGWVGVRK